MYLSLQGNVGLGKAIEYFTSKAIPVSIPLNDTQKYDLVVDISDKLYRVSVKTATHIDENGSYNVYLKNSGGASPKGKTRLFDNKSCDYIFILTGNNETYLIPSSVITAKSGIVLGKKYSQYIVVSDSLDDFIKNMAE